jgi:hypothetical protein
MPELFEHLNPMAYEAIAQMEKDLCGAGYTVAGGPKACVCRQDRNLQGRCVRVRAGFGRRGASASPNATGLPTFHPNGLNPASHQNARQENSCAPGLGRNSARA